MTDCMVALSPRLHTVAELVRPGEPAADIGTDHGLLAIALRERDQVPQVYACDLRPEPLAVAQRNLDARSQLSGLELRLGDGLAPVAGLTLGTATIAGMGGATMEAILDRGPLKGITRLVLAPNEALERLRRALHRHGLWPVREVLVEDGGRHYVVVAAERGDAPADPSLEDFVIGPQLRTATDPTQQRLRARWATERLERFERSLRGLAAAHPDNAAAQRKRDRLEARVAVFRRFAVAR